MLQNSILDNEFDFESIKEEKESEGVIEFPIDNINKDKAIFTTLVRIKGAKHCNVISVKSTEAINKNLFIDCSKALSRLYVGTPIKIGDVVCKNILNTGVDIICTRNVDS